MPSTTLPQKIAEISKELEALRAQRLSHPEKTADMLQNGLRQLQVNLKELTMLAGACHGKQKREVSENA